MCQQCANCAHFPTYLSGEQKMCKCVAKSLLTIFPVNTDVNDWRISPFPHNPFEWTMRRDLYDTLLTHGTFSGTNAVHRTAHRTHTNTPSVLLRRVSQYTHTSTKMVSKMRNSSSASASSQRKSHGKTDRHRCAVMMNWNTEIQFNSSTAPHRWQWWWRCCRQRRRRRRCDAVDVTISRCVCMCMCVCVCVRRWFSWSLSREMRHHIAARSDVCVWLCVSFRHGMLRCLCFAPTPWTDSVYMRIMIIHLLCAPLADVRHDPRVRRHADMRCRLSALDEISGRAQIRIHTVGVDLLLACSENRTRDEKEKLRCDHVCAFGMPITNMHACTGDKQTNTHDTRAHAMWCGSGPVSAGPPHAFYEANAIARSPKTHAHENIAWARLVCVALSSRWPGVRLGTRGHTCAYIYNCMYHQHCDMWDDTCGTCVSWFCVQHNVTHFSRLFNDSFDNSAYYILQNTDCHSYLVEWYGFCRYAGGS